MLTDPRLRKVQAVVGIILERTEAYNWPITAQERVGGSVKPGSRSPGEEQCEWAVKKMLDLTERFTASAVEILDAAKPKQRGTVVHSVGGLPIDGSSSRRGPYRHKS